MASTTQRPKSRGGTKRRATGTRSRTSTATRSRPSLRRKQPKSKAQQILGAVSGAVPAAASRAPAKGIALLGAAGGVAAVLKNRSKLPFGGGGSPTGTSTTSTTGAKN